MASVIADTFKVLVGITPDEKSFNDVENKIKGLSNTLASLGKAGGFLYFANTLNNITQKIIDATQATSRWAVEMGRVAKKSGVSNEVMQRLQILEQQKGIQQGAIASGLQSIAEKQAKARKGFGVDMGFYRSGIDIRHGTPAEIMQKFIDKFAKAPLWKQLIASQETGLDMSLLELQGADIRNIPSSMVFNDEQNKQLTDINEKFGNFNAQWKIFKEKLLMFTLPLVDKFLTIMSKLLDAGLKFTEKIQKNEKLMQRINTVLTSIVALVGILVVHFLPMFLSSIASLLGFFLKIGGLYWLKMLGKIPAFLGKFPKGIALIVAKLIVLKEKVWALYTGTTVFVKLLSGLWWMKIKNFLGVAVTGIGNIIKVLVLLGKRILILGAQILASPITWLIGSLTLIGAIIGDLITYALTGEAKISKGLLEFTQKYFPNISDWVKKIHEFMNDAGAGMMDIWGAVKVLFGELWKFLQGTYDYGVKLMNNFFDQLDQRFAIFSKMQNAVENISLGWGTVTGSTQKMLKEQEAKMLAEQERVNALVAKKRTNDALAYLGNLVSPANRRTAGQYQSTANNNMTVNNTNNFMLDGADNPDQLATLMTQKLAGVSFTNGLNRSGNLFNNGGR